MVVNYAEDQPSYIGYKVKNMGFEGHLTVLYFGDNNPESLYTLLAERRWRGPLCVTRKNIEMFGPHNDIPVITVHIPPFLRHLRKYSEALVSSASKYCWNPHITIDLTSPIIHLPERIELDDLGIY